jgi:hypothetical protein
VWWVGEGEKGRNDKWARVMSEVVCEEEPAGR